MDRWVSKLDLEFLKLRILYVKPEALTSNLPEQTIPGSVVLKVTLQSNL